MHTVSSCPPSDNGLDQLGTRPKDRAGALRKRIDDSLEVLAKSVDDVRASGAFKQFLDVQARFHRYSWHNTLLIAMQRPDASQVAGFRQWKKLDRHVCKGERGIMIFAPCPFKREVEKTDGETETVDGIFFKPVYVFDVAQTEGKDLPTVDVPILQSSAGDLLAKLIGVAHGRKIDVQFGAIASGAFGVSKRGTVEIDNTHPTGQQAKTLAHEIAHELLHWDNDGALALDRNTAELEAESVAYVVCRHFGVDSDVRSSRYIAIWGGDSKALKTSLERIASTARDIIDEAEVPKAMKAMVA